MQERTAIRQGEKIVEVRSDVGKLLYVKTKKGYEFKCPRSKQICVIAYEAMIADCLICLEEVWNDK